MDKTQFKKMTGISEQLASQWFLHIKNAMSEFSITAITDIAMFISQVGHESGGFQQVVESLNYSPAALLKTYGKRITPQQAQFFGRTDSQSAQQDVIANIVYANRMGNKNTGDGWKYRGRGLIQITGAENYQLCGKALKIDLIHSPELLEEYNLAARSAAWFYTAKGCLRHSDDIIRVTRIINGGENGLDDRLARFEKALEVLSV